MTRSDHTEMQERYARAARLMQGHRAQTVVRNGSLYPRWIGDTGYFWYVRHTHQGHEYRLVNGDDGENTGAFDHAAFAKALCSCAGEPVDPHQLPITQVEISLSPLRIAFKAFEKHWIFHADRNECRAASVVSEDPCDSLSSDGAYVAFSRNSNLWIRSVSTGEERALTDDGEEGYGYGVPQAGAGAEISYGDLCALWSPNGEKLLFLRRDRRRVRKTPYINYIPKDGEKIRPQGRDLTVAYPGDEVVETYELFVADREGGGLVKAQYPPIPVTRKDCVGFFKVANSAWWSVGGRRVFFLDHDRYGKYLRVVSFDAQTGETNIVFEEKSDTYVTTMFVESCPPVHRPLKTRNELLWWSEQSGWGHLYLINLENGDVTPLTGGAWLVRQVLDIDERWRTAIIQTAGRDPGLDPYYRDICRLDLDSGEMTPILETDDDVTVQFPDNYKIMAERFAGTYRSQMNGVSPARDRIVVTRARVDRTPVHILIDERGRQVAEIETADPHGLPKGWIWPEPFTVRAADGKTDLFGVIHRPSDFCPEKSYPVLNFMNGAPWLQAVPKSSFGAADAYSDRHYYHGAALAELGFIVIQLDSRGTPFRSKAFRDQSYGWIQSAANYDDHVAAVKELAGRFPYFDLDRVGIVAKSYTAGIQNFLERQDFYKACLSWFVMDYRLCFATLYSDLFEGPEPGKGDNKYPEELVSGLKGELCVMYPMNAVVSQFYNPAGAFRLLDALQEANKDFELVMVHDGGFSCSNYMFRRGFDFLVRELRGEEPPKEFDLGRIQVGLLAD